MNRLVVSILLLAVMSAGCFWSVFITIDKTNELSGYIDQVEQAHSEGDSEAAVKYANQLHDAWDSVLHYSILVNDLGHAMEITSCIAEISSFAEEGDDELYAACDRAQAQLRAFPRNADSHALENTLTVSERIRRIKLLAGCEPASMTKKSARKKRWRNTRL